MADSDPANPKLPASSDNDGEHLLPVIDPGSSCHPPGSWTLTIDEEQKVFRLWKGFTLAERSKDTLSWVWNYGVEIQSTTSRRWVCMPCVRQKVTRPQSYESRGTQNAEIHLWKVHGLWDPSGRRSAPAEKKGGKRVFASVTDFMNLNRSDPKDQAFANSVIKRFDRAHFLKLLVNWIVESQLSFKQIEHPRLQQIFDYLNPAVKVTDAHITGKTIRKLAIQQFERHRATVQDVLRMSPGQIHIAFDGARTRNRHTLYGVTATFRDTDNQLQKIVLGIPELIDRHSGENIATEILDIIKSFGIEDKVGYFTLDNAPNNDTAMAEIAGELKIDAVQRRVRCIGHILNLVVKALLFGKDADAFEESLVNGELLARAAHDLWMQKGPVGKAHNFVVWVHRSDMLTQLLRQLQQDFFEASDDAKVRKQKPVDVIVDNDTRWLSQYYMIRRLLRLQPFYEEFIAKAKRMFQDSRAGHRLPPCLEKTSFIDEIDWTVLKAFDELLYDFHVVVQVLQGDGQSRHRPTGVKETFGSMTDVLEAFEFLLGKLEEAKSLVERYPEPEQFGININLGWKKLDKYYCTLKDSPVYYAAAALHPSLRWNYFEEVWGQQHPGWVQEAKDIVQRLWDAEYRDLQITISSPEGPVVKMRKTKLSSFDKYRNTYRQSQLAWSQSDEYTRWQANTSSSERDITDPIEYWILKRFEYPRLSRMALDVMTVPAMSSECERLFSATGLMVTPLRNRLDAGTIGLIQTLRSWLRAGIVEDVDSILLEDTTSEYEVELAGSEEYED